MTIGVSYLKYEKNIETMLSDYAINIGISGISVGK